MRFSDFHKLHDPVISFELYPPRTPEAQVELFDRGIAELMELSPAFLTCTYGAGGSTRDKTLEIVTRIKNEFNIEAVSHLTCIGASRDEIADYLELARQAGITNIVALRGDPPTGDDAFKPNPDGFTLGVELVSFIKSLGGFDVAVAGYPEGHPDCPDKYLDWQRCREKIEAGADIIMTQLFYDNRDFFEFVDHLRNKLGVKAPIHAGILPILSTRQIRRFCEICKAKLPAAVQKRLDAYADDNEACFQYGVDLATEMCDELIRNGVEGLHFYTINRARSTGMVLRNLGLVAARGEPGVGMPV